MQYWLVANQGFVARPCSLGEPSVSAVLRNIRQILRKSKYLSCPQGSTPVRQINSTSLSSGTVTGRRREILFQGQHVAYEIINIPLSSGSKTFNADDVNKFCANKKSIARKVEFFQQDGSVIKSCVAGGRKPRKTKIYHPLLLLKTAI